MHANTAEAVLEELTWHERFLTDHATLLTSTELTERRRRITMLRLRLAAPRQLAHSGSAGAAVQWLAIFFIYCFVLRIRDSGIRTLLWTQLLCLAHHSWLAVRVAYLPPFFHDAPMRASNRLGERTPDAE
jgi:hypothetical protein